MKYSVNYAGRLFFGSDLLTFKINLKQHRSLLFPKKLFLRVCHDER